MVSEKCAKNLQEVLVKNKWPKLSSNIRNRNMLDSRCTRCPVKIKFVFFFNSVQLIICVFSEISGSFFGGVRDIENLGDCLCLVNLYLENCRYLLSKIFQLTIKNVEQFGIVIFTLFQYKLCSILNIIFHIIFRMMQIFT